MDSAIASLRKGQPIIRLSNKKPDLWPPGLPQVDRHTSLLGPVFVTSQVCAVTSTLSKTRHPDWSSFRNDLSIIERTLPTVISVYQPLFDWRVSPYLSINKDFELIFEPQNTWAPIVHGIRRLRWLAPLPYAISSDCFKCELHTCKTAVFTFKWVLSTLRQRPDALPVNGFYHVLIDGSARCKERLRGLTSVRAVGLHLAYEGLVFDDTGNLPARDLLEFRQAIFANRSLSSLDCTGSGSFRSSRLLDTLVGACVPTPDDDLFKNTSLKHLKIDTLSRQGLLTMLSTFSCLTSLHVKQTLLWDVSLSEAVLRLPALKHLSLEIWQIPFFLKEMDWSHSLWHCLESLTMHYCPAPPHFSDLARLVKLKNLSLSIGVNRVASWRGSHPALLTVWPHLERGITIACREEETVMKWLRLWPSSLSHLEWNIEFSPGDVLRWQLAGLGLRSHLLLTDEFEAPQSHRSFHQIF